MDGFGVVVAMILFLVAPANAAPRLAMLAVDSPAFGSSIRA